MTTKVPEYEYILGMLEKAIGIHPMTTSEITHWCTALIPEYTGTFARDLFDKKKHRICIINTDPSNQSGEHWLGYFDGLVYDSFGRMYNDIGVATERDIEQNEKDINCGHRAIAFLLICYYFGKSLGSLI